MAKLTKTWTIRFDPALFQRVKVEAEAEGRPFGNYVRHVLRQVVDNKSLSNGAGQAANTQQEQAA